MIEKGERVAFRLDTEDAELLRKIVEDRGENASTFVRRLIRLEFCRLGYLSREKAKSLGIKQKVLPAS
jgi:Ribbon-helix-helix protein, copG family